MKVYTIGFSRKGAEQFFETLKRHDISCLLDVRLNNTSQLAGYTKLPDLGYFLLEICSAAYLHLPQLAPTRELLDSYKKKKITWKEYESRYLALLREREVESQVQRRLLDGPSILLCSEPTPDYCHRRLALEYLQEQWGDMKIEAVHL